MKKLAALCLSLTLLLTACNFDFFATAVTPENTQQPTIAYVPLDDRPVDTDRVKYLAQACGFDILMPDADLYATHLDNQLTNANGTQYGDRKGLLKWLKSVEGQCDAYALSLDQLLSGGLVNSRCMTETDVSFENSVIDYLAYLGNHNRKVYVFDTVMRLACTSGYNGYDISEYNATRVYGMQLRQTLSGEELTVDNIVAGYRYDADGAPVETSLSEQQVAEYTASRERKLRLIDTMLTRGNRENCYYYVGVDDANPAENIQYNEIQYIRSKLGDDGVLFAATDDLGMMTVAKIIADKYPAVSARVRYYGGQEDYAADDYDIGTLRSNVEGHLGSLGTTLAGDTDTADMEFLVLTKPTVAASYSQYIDKLMQQLQTNLTQQMPTVVLDASTNSYYGELQQRLIDEADMSRLLGYSNWNTVGNTIGISVAQGISRYTYLKNSPIITGASHIAFLQSMGFAYVKDIAYKIERNDDAVWFLKTAMNTASFPGKRAWNQGNYYAQMQADGFTAEQVNGQLAYLMTSGYEQHSMTDILRNLSDGSMITDLHTYTTREVGTVEVSDFSFPWYRDFEMRFAVTATLADTVTSTGGSGYVVNERNALITGVTTGTTAAAFCPRFAGAKAFSVSDAYGGALTDTERVGTGCVLTAAFDGNTRAYTAVVMGDMDGNGMLNSSDARSILVAVVGGALRAAQTIAADYDQNDSINSRDVREVMMCMLT